MASEREKAVALFLACRQKAFAQMQIEYSKLVANPVKITTVEETRTLSRFGTRLLLGYTLSGAAGFGLAHWLNKRPKPGYKPGVFGYLAFTLGFAMIGGSLNASSATANVVTDLIKAPGSTAGRMMCQGIKEMKPCIDDPACHKLLQTGRTNKMLEWYTLCQRRNNAPAAIGGARAPTAGDSSGAGTGDGLDWGDVSPDEFLPDAPGGEAFDSDKTERTDR